METWLWFVVGVVAMVVAGIVTGRWMGRNQHRYPEPEEIMKEIAAEKQAAMDLTRRRMADSLELPDIEPRERGTWGRGSKS